MITNPCSGKEWSVDIGFVGLPLFEEKYAGDYAPHPQHHECTRQHYIFAPEDSFGCQVHKPAPLPPRRVVVVRNLNAILASLKVSFDPAPQLLEIRQAGCPHPDDKVLVFWVNPLN